MLAFIFIPVIQKELDVFKNVVWNHKRGRKQSNKELPTGIPEYIHDNPEEFGAENCGSDVTEDSLLLVGQDYDIDLDECFIAVDLFQRFSVIFPDVDDIKLQDTVDAFLYLKSNYTVY